MYSGQAMVHTSGALGAEVLAAGHGRRAPRSARSIRSSRSPTRNGRSPRCTGRRSRSRATTSWRRSSPRWPSASGATAVRLAPGSKAAYHAAAVLAAGGFIALLDAIAELGAVAGLDEAGALAIYGPLIEGTLGNARALGIRAALTGPMTRGDVGHPRRAPGRAGRPCPRRARAVRRRGAPRDRPRPGPWRARTGDRGGHDARPLDGGACKGRLNRYHCGPWDTASPPSTRLGRRPVSCVRRAGRGSGDWVSARSRSFSAVAARQTELRGPRPARTPACAPAGADPRRDPADRPRRSAATAGPDALGPLRALRVRVGVPAPPRRRGTPEDRDRHVRGRHRRPVRGRASPTRHR